jgi:hypothetical protein
MNKCWTPEKTVGGASLRRNGLIKVHLEVSDDNEVFYYSTALEECSNFNAI